LRGIILARAAQARPAAINLRVQSASGGQGIAASKKRIKLATRRIVEII
jgi:hypothetical protein